MGPPHALLLGVGLPFRDIPEAIWGLTGLLLAIVMVVSLDSIAVHVLGTSAKKSSPARRWDHATTTVRSLLDGDTAASTAFSKLLSKSDTREIAIDALTNAARMRPDAAVVLRDRDRDVAEITDWVNGALSEKDPGQRSHACEVVATLRLRSCRGLILAATEDADSTVRVSACRALSGLDPEEAVGVLLGLVDKEGPWVSGLLSEVVARLPETATAALVRRANEWGASPALVRLLANSPSQDANDLLLAALDDTDPEVRARSAEAVVPSTPEAVAALTSLLTDEHEGTRLSAVRSLVRAGADAPLMSLVAALSDESRVVRFAAAEGVAELPGGRSVLARAASGPDPGVAEAAELALWRLDNSIAAAEVAAEVAAEAAAVAVAVAGAPTTDGASDGASDGANDGAGPTPTGPNESVLDLTPFEEPEPDVAVTSDPVVEPAASESAHERSAASEGDEKAPGDARTDPAPRVRIPKRRVPQSADAAQDISPVTAPGTASETGPDTTHGGEPATSETTAAPTLPKTPAPRTGANGAGRKAPTVPKRPGRAPQTTPSAENTDQLERTSSTPTRPGPAAKVTKPASAKPSVTKPAAATPATTKPAATPTPTSTPTPTPTPPATGNGPRTDVETWLITALRRRGGEAPAPMIKDEATQQGYAERTIERARSAVAYSRRVGFGEGAIWVLKEEHRAPVESATRADVETWMISALRRHGGEAPSTVIRDEATAVGFAERTIERARASVAHSRRVGFGEGSIWVLKEEHRPAIAQPARAKRSAPAQSADR